MNTNISIEKEVKTAFKPATIYGMGYIAQNFLFLLCTILIAKILGPDNFGLYSLALSIVGVGAMLSTLGMNVVPSRFIPRYLHKGESSKLKTFLKFICKTQILASILIAAALILSSGYISGSIYKKAGLVLPLILLSLMMPIQKTNELIGSIFSGFKKVQYSVYVQNWVAPLLRIGAMTLVFFFWRGAAGVYSALYVQLTLTLIIFCFVFKNKIWNNYLYNVKQEASFNKREILAYGLPLFIPYMINYLMGRLDILLIGYFLSADQVGIYNIVFKLSLIVALSLLSLNSIFSPIISELYAKGELAKLEHSYKSFTRTILYVSVFCLGAIFILGRPLLNMIGNEYASGYGTLFVLSIGQLLFVSVGSASKFFSMTEHPRVTLYNSLGQLTLNLILNILLIPKYGIIGAAFATSISITSVNFVRLIEMKMLFKIHPFSLSYLKPLLAGSVAFGLALWVPIDTLWINFGLFTTAYILASVLLGIGEEERQMISLVTNYRFKPSLRD